MSKALTIKLVEAKRQVAIKAWEAGNFQKARRILREVLSRKDELTFEEILVFTINLAIVEMDDGKADVAHSLFLETAPLADASDNPDLKGKFYNEYAITCRRLGKNDEAFQFYTAASFYYEEANDFRKRTDVENNIAFLLISTGLPADAHSHLDRARQGCHDEYILAEIDDTRALALLKQNLPDDALTFQLSATRSFKVLGRGKRYTDAVRQLQEICEQVLHHAEKEELRRALMETDGHVPSVAKLLGLNRQYVEKRIERHHRDLLPLWHKTTSRGKYAKS